MIVGITGATGIIYGVRLLEALKELGIERHLVLSKAAEITRAYETSLEFPVLVGLGRSERGAEAPPGARLPCCGCCTRPLQVSWNRDPRPASRQRWADGWARSCCPSRNRHGARVRNSSWAGCWPAVGTSRRRS